jgi:hypothetical protein
MYTVSGGNCPSFLCATSSSLLMLTVGPVWRRSRKRLPVFRTVGSAKRYRFKPCMKLKLHCNHKSGYLKTEHTGNLFLLRRHLGNWPRGPAVSMKSELLVTHEKLGQLMRLTMYVLPI